MEKLSLPEAKSFPEYGAGKEISNKTPQSKSPPGANVIKLITDVIYKFLNYDSVFVPGKPIQPSLMFSSNAF